MSDPKNYISVINNGTTDLYIKDAEAQQAIADLQKSVTGAMHFLGLSTTAITDEAATGPWTIEGKTYIASGTPAEGQILLKAGDAALYAKKEFVWNGSMWREYGDMSDLKSLAYKDASDIETGGSTSQKLVTTTITGVSGSTSASSVSKTAKALGITTITGTNGTESVSAVERTEKKLGKTSVGSASAWSDGTLASLTYDSTNEKLTFSAGAKPSLTITSTAVATGSLVATSTEGAGDTLVDSVTITSKTVAKAADSATTVATGSLVAADAQTKGAGIIEDVTISSVTVPIAAQSATTVATGSVVAATETQNVGASVITAVSTTIQNKPSV